MKKYILVFGLIVFVGLLPISNVYGDTYLLLTVGGGNAGSIGIEGGWLGQKFLLGIGFSVIFPKDSWRMTNANVFGSSYQRTGPEGEGYGSAGIMILQDWFLVITAGLYYESIQSKTVTYGGTSVEWDPEFKEPNLAYSGQLQYTYDILIVGGGYHNRRGIVGRIGIRF